MMGDKLGNMDDSAALRFEAERRADMVAESEYWPDYEPDHDDTVLYCPDCERPNQFGEQCESCRRDADAHYLEMGGE